MAQLKDTTIDGSLKINNNIILQKTGQGISGVHPVTGESTRMLHLSSGGNTILGYDGYSNVNGDTYIYGNDVTYNVASAGNVTLRPYRRIGDVIEFSFRTAGYVTNSGKTVSFTIPSSRPILGAPTAVGSSIDGFCLRQNNSYTHGSSATTYVKASSLTVSVHSNIGFTVTAVFDDTTNVVNNTPIGIYWSGTITLS